MGREEGHGHWPDTRIHIEPGCWAHVELARSYGSIYVPIVTALNQTKQRNSVSSAPSALSSLARGEGGAGGLPPDL